MAVLLAALLAFSCAKEEEKKEMAVSPVAELVKSIENGKKLFNDASLGTSGMTCNSCHMQGGTRDGKMKDMAIPAFSDLASKYPKYFGMAKKVMTLSQVNNWCILTPLKGEPLKWDDQKLADLTAYVASVRGKSEVAMKAMPGAKKALAKSVENGKKLFSDASLGTSGMTCSSCHMEGGTKGGKMGDMTIAAFDNVASKYPRFFGTAKKVMTLSQVNNFCIVMPLKGEPLKWDDQKLTDLSAYVASVKAKSE